MSDDHSPGHYPLIIEAHPVSAHLLHHSFKSRLRILRIILCHAVFFRKLSRHVFEIRQIDINISIQQINDLRLHIAAAVIYKWQIKASFPCHINGLYYLENIVIRCDEINI